MRPNRLDRPDDLGMPYGLCFTIRLRALTPATAQP
jgi:hypothetical protein